MATLFDQPNRRYRHVCEGRHDQLDSFLADAGKLAKKHHVSVSTVIAAAHALELRRMNDLYVDNGDAWDEQIGGIGTLLKEMVSAMKGES